MIRLPSLSLAAAILLAMALPAQAASFEGGPVSVLSAGAIADGTTDATEAIRAAIAKVAANGGGEVFFPAGRYRVDGSLQIPTGVQLRGSGRAATTLIAPANVATDFLRIDNARDVAVRDLTLLEAAEGGKAKGAAIAIDNGSRFIIIENVAVDGFRAGFAVGRAEGEISANITFRNCLTERSRSFGFEMNQCREVLIDSSYAYHHWLDGIKLRKHTRDVTIRGGESSHNGTSQLADPRWNGNGVDAYAGGDAFLIDGLLTEYNHGSGIYMKTGQLQNSDYGTVGNAMITNVRSRHNIGSGLDINRSGGDVGKGLEAPLVANVSVIGGVFEENTRSGIYVRARNVAIVAPIIRKNDQHGIELASVYDVSILAPLISANSQSKPGQFNGISVGSGELGAHRVKISGGTINGTDTGPQAASNANAAAAAAVSAHRRAIFVSERSSEVVIDDVSFPDWNRAGEPVEQRQQSTSQTSRK